MTPFVEMELVKEVHMTPAGKLVITDVRGPPRIQERDLVASSAHAQSGAGWWWEFVCHRVIS